MRSLSIQYDPDSDMSELASAHRSLSARIGDPRNNEHEC
jgi:hypothetical protein